MIPIVEAILEIENNKNNSQKNENNSKKDLTKNNFDDILNVEIEKLKER